MWRRLPLRLLCSNKSCRTSRRTAATARANDRTDNGYYILLPAIPPDTPQTNPLLRADKPPEFEQISEQQIASGLQKLAIDYETAFYRIEEDVQKSRNQRFFNSLFDPLDKLNHGLIHAFTAAQILALTKKSSNLDDLLASSQVTLSRCQALTNGSQTILRTLKEILHEQRQLSEPQRRVVDKYLLEAKLNGLDLNSKHSLQFRSVRSAMCGHQEKFRSLVNTSTKSFLAPALSPAMLDDVPVDLSRKAFTAPDGTPKNPHATLKNPGYDVLMGYCADREMRKLLYTARSTRAGFQNPDTNNSLVIEDIRQARAREAQLLGFDNFAALSMQTKMAGSVANVMAAISELTLPAKIKCQAELESLQKFASQAHLKGDLQIWDVAYWKRRQRDHLYPINSDEVRSFFPFPEVWSGLTSLCADLFGIKIKKSTNKPQVWHKDVEFYQIFDGQNGGEELGAFYVDAYSRPENKHQGEHFIPMQNRSQAAKASPLAALIFNFRPPTVKGPSMLSYDDLNLLFQKFGSALQHLLCKVPYGDVSGFNNVEWDALHISGNLFRMLLQNPKLLQGLSKNADGKQLSMDAVQSVQKYERHLSSLGLITEMYYAVLDLQLHTKTDFWQEVMRATWKDFMPFAQLKDDAHPCSFSQIFAGPYPAAYYSFLWSEMVAADIYQSFADDQERSGHRFRETFLELGGGCHASEVFRRFSRGRDPSPQGLLKINEIITT